METGDFGQDDKKWHRPWSTEEIRKNSTNWTLAGDVGLYNLLTEFSQNIISKTHEVGNSVDNLVHKSKMASIKINNIINDFHMLSNLQFVENRVYDEEIIETVPETKPAEKSKEQREAEMLPKLVQAVELGLKVLDQSFVRVNVDEISDSEDEDLSSEGRTILEPKDPYEHRPLPYIIGSEDFQNCDYAGLKDLIEEDIEPSLEVESSVSDSDETSSDEEDLPLDDERDGKPNGPLTQRELSQTISSSSDESELFGSETKQENGYGSDSSLGTKAKEGKNIQRLNEEIKVAVKENRQSSVSSMQSKLNLPQVLPTPKTTTNKKKESDDLFVNDDELSDDDSPFRKKTGLFSTDVRFDDKDMFEGDLFGEKSKESKKAVENPKVSPANPTATKAKEKEKKKKKDEPSLFSNDEESDDDIFNTIIKAKVPHKEKNVATMKKSPEQTDSVSTTPSSKPSAGFDFATNDSLFGDESDQDDLFSTRKTSKKFDFDSVDDDDLFGMMGDKNSKKKEVAEIKKEKSENESEKSSLFDESEEVVDKKPFQKIGLPLPGLVPSQKDEPVPKEDEKPKKSFQKFGTALPGLTNKMKNSLFGDSDNSDQEEKPNPSPLKETQEKEVQKKETQKKETQKKETQKKETQKKEVQKKEAKISLFDDDGDEDIFSQEPRQLLSPGKSPSVKNHTEKPSSAHEVVSKPVSENEVKKPKGLFDEDEDDLIFTLGPKKAPVMPSASKKLESSLFEESDRFDLFTPKPVGKKAEPHPHAKVPVHVEKQPAAVVIGKKDSVPTITSKDLPNENINKATPKDKITPVGESAPEVGKSSFDVPVDSSKTLHVLSKDRARISAKRRPPTKKGRLSSVENGSENKVLAPASSTSDNDDLFTSSSKSVSSQSALEEKGVPVAKAASHKQQEKKKMDLMSQLMSEAASKRTARKSIVQDEEDEVDIFSEATKKDKSQSFSFRSPIESAPSQEADKPADEKDDNDDFFAEPSFKNFRSSISHKDSVLNLEGDDEDDDLFSSIKAVPKVKPETPEDDIFGEDESDIFADLQKEKYEMFPSQSYEDEDDTDIFSSIDKSSHSSKSADQPQKMAAPVKKEVEKKPVFDDPLSGLLGDD